MKITCLIVDDEPLSRKVVKNYIKDLPGLELVGECSNAFAAIEFLEKENIQLLFLDINMPKLSGINFIRSLNDPPLVVFITAYPEYAVEGFEVEAVDYLVKPFSQARFVKAVQKVRKILRSAQADKERELLQADSLLVKADKKLYKLPFSDILYLQAYGDYVKIFTKQKMLTPKETLNRLEKQLPHHRFVRIHRSYLVALSAIQYIEGNALKVKDQMLPIGQKYREGLIARFNG